MAKELLNNVKLGVLISAGLAVLIVALYLVGKNQNFFGSNFHLRARFSNVNGLMAGNNVRYSGIQIGTVSKILVIDDSTIEVNLSVNKDMKRFIHENAIADIGNDGLMGNKVINITPSKIPAGEIADNGLLHTLPMSGTDQIMETLTNTSTNVEALSKKLIIAVDQLNNSSALWSLLNDTTIPSNVRNSIYNLNQATTTVNSASLKVNNLFQRIQNGEGTIGMLIADKKTEADTRAVIKNITDASQQSKVLLTNMNDAVKDIQHDISYGKGTAHALLKDTVMAYRLSNSMENIEKGTKAFSQDMEALKHNFLLRGYFRRQARRHNSADN